MLNSNNERALKVACHIASILKKENHLVYTHKKMSDEIVGSIGCDTHFAVADKSDFFIAIGGDGTIIHTAKHANNKPILGVNLGRLGYIAGLELSDIDCIPSLINNGGFYEERMLLDIFINEKFVGNALNEGVISTEQSKILDYEVFCDGSEFKYRADGLIVATPTGSTAYSMSAGGPVVDPLTRCMIFTPICPHSFFNRSIIFGDEFEIKVRLVPRSEEKMYLTLDGEKPFDLSAKDEVVFKASDKRVKLLTKEKRNFFKLLNNKLL